MADMKPPLMPEPDGTGVYRFPDGSLIGPAPSGTRWEARWKPKPEGRTRAERTGARLTEEGADGTSTVTSYFRSPELAARALEAGGEGPCSMPGYAPAAPPAGDDGCAHLPDPDTVEVATGHDAEAEGGVVLTFKCLHCGAVGNGKLAGLAAECTVLWDDEDDADEGGGQEDGH